MSRRFPTPAGPYWPACACCWIACAARLTPSHLSVTQALALAAQLGAAHTVLIHMTHELEYHSLSADCPAGVEVGYDGMRLQLSYG